jgi:hypothetical protein
MRTLQEAFDTAAIHMLEQGRRSINSNDACLYRGADGLKCAVGALITDVCYSTCIEHCDIHDNDVISAIRDSGWPIDEPSMCVYYDLQGIHDDVHPSAWRTSLVELGTKYSLSTSALEEFKP